MDKKSWHLDIDFHTKSLGKGRYLAEQQMPKTHKLITRIPRKAIFPHAKELVLRCGSCEKASIYSGIGVGTMYRIVVYKEYDAVQMDIARKILDALIQKRYEDRVNGYISKQYLDDRLSKARIEERLEREI